MTPTTKHRECTYCGKVREVVKLKKGLYICRECDQTPVKSAREREAEKQYWEDWKYGVNPNKRVR